MARRHSRRLMAAGLAVALGLAPKTPAQGTAGREDGHASSAPMCEIAGVQASRYPLMNAEDLYKFAHQAAFGPAHAIPDPGSAREWMAREIGTLEAPAAGEPGHRMFESLLPDGSLVRVHLRPWIQAGRDPEALLSAFVQTASNYQSSPETLKVYWGCFRELTGAGVLPLEVDVLDAYLAQRESEGWPAVHHSEAFEAAYAPAYRVVWKEYLSASPEHRAP